MCLDQRQDFLRVLPSGLLVIVVMSLIRHYLIRQTVSADRLLSAVGRTLQRDAIAACPLGADKYRYGHRRQSRGS